MSMMGVMAISEHKITKPLNSLFFIVLIFAIPVIALRELFDHLFTDCIDDTCDEKKQEANCNQGT